MIVHKCKHTHFESHIQPNNHTAHLMKGGKMRNRESKWRRVYKFCISYSNNTITTSLFISWENSRPRWNYGFTLYNSHCNFVQNWRTEFNKRRRFHICIVSDLLIGTFRSHLHQLVWWHCNGTSPLSYEVETSLIYHWLSKLLISVMKQARTITGRSFYIFFFSFSLLYDKIIQNQYLFNCLPTEKMTHPV